MSQVSFGNGNVHLRHDGARCLTALEDERQLDKLLARRILDLAVMSEAALAPECCLPLRRKAFEELLPLRAAFETRAPRKP